SNPRIAVLQTATLPLGYPANVRADNINVAALVSSADGREIGAGVSAFTNDRQLRRTFCSRAKADPRWRELAGARVSRRGRGAVFCRSCPRLAPLDDRWSGADRLCRQLGAGDSRTRSSKNR